MTILFLRTGTVIKDYLFIPHNMPEGLVQSDTGYIIFMLSLITLTLTLLALTFLSVTKAGSNLCGGRIAQEEMSQYLYIDSYIISTIKVAIPYKNY